MQRGRIRIGAHKHLHGFHACVVCVIVLAAICGGATETTAADAKIKLGLDNLHGPTEFLRQSLRQSPEEARLLAAAQRQLIVGDSDLAFQALQAIFAHEHDSFTPVYADKPSTSTYRAAFELLQSADFKTRKQWSESMEVLASAALKAANAEGDSGKIAGVGRQFPFTQSGLYATAMAAMTARSLGQNAFATAMLSEAERTYEQTPLNFNATPLLNDLRSRIRSPLSQSAESAEFAGSVVPQSPTQLSLPWPEPLWRWEEALWSNGAMATIFGGITLPENRSLLTMSSWRPAFTDSTIILRTPARIACFDKLTGQIEWQLRTDTVESQPKIQLDIDEQPLKSNTSLADLLQMDDLGSLTASESAVFFVDHFRRFQGEPTLPVGRNLLQRQGIQNRLIESLETPASSGGRRLVCVQLKPKPNVAWTIGDAPKFNYLVTDQNKTTIQSVATTKPHAPTEATDPPDTAPIIESDEHPNRVPSPFSQHHFLGPPLAHDQLLYVLSADREIAWINCLTQSTGRLLWREPIAYHSASSPGVSNRYVVFSEDPVGASLCGIDGNVIISALNNGVVVGTDMTDGKLLWATNFREPERAPGSRLGMAYLGRTVDYARASFQPLLTNGRMIWAAPQSGLVRCVDTQSGKILWTRSCEAKGTGCLEDSVDNYAVSVDDKRVIMMGTRHIRSLSMSDGSQQWISEIQRQGGRAFCNGHTCLVPQLDGSLALFDVRTGVRQSVSSEFAFAENVDFAGSLYSDDQVLCAATPVSVTLLPTHSLMLSRHHENDISPSTPEHQLLKARLHLIAGDPTAGISVLRQLLTTLPSNKPGTDKLRQTCQRLLVDTILNSVSRQHYETVGDAAKTVDTTALDELHLNPHQQLRYQLLAPEKRVLSTELNMQTSPIVRLTPDWAVRADVSAYAALSNERAHFIARPAVPDSITIDNMERAILFPSQIGNIEQQLIYAQHLVQRNFRAAAELFLVSALQSAVEPDATAIRRQQQKLRSLSQSTQTVIPQVVVNNAEFKMYEEISLSIESAIPQILAATNAIVETPDWYPERLFIVGRNFHSINLSTGAVSVPRRIPAQVEAADVTIRDDVPGLVPLTGTNQVGMLSLLEPEHPQLLWWRRIQKDVADPSPVEIGPIGPGFVIVATSSVLQCLHPLTGATLWERKLTASVPSRSLFRRTVRIIGDHRVVGVFGERSESCTLFRTLDGKRLNTISLNIPQGQSPLVSGRMVLYQNKQQLALVDLLTGKNLLDGKPPIRVLKNGMGRLLKNHKAAVLTAEGSLTVLDMATGDVTMSCSLGEDFNQAQLVGLTIIERDNRLFFLAKDFGNTQRHLSATSRMGDPRLDSGTLYCINPETGTLLWQRTSLPSVMPQIHGDSINVLLLWSLQNPGYYTEQQLDTDRQTTQRSLLLTLVDADTGKTIAEGSHFSPTEPLRCIHDAAKNRIEVHAEKSIISIDYVTSRNEK